MFIKPEFHNAADVEGGHMRNILNCECTLFSCILILVCINVQTEILTTQAIWYHETLYNFQNLALALFWSISDLNATKHTIACGHVIWRLSGPLNINWENKDILHLLKLKYMKKTSCLSFYILQACCGCGKCFRPVFLGVKGTSHGNNYVVNSVSKLNAIYKSIYV